MYRFAMFIIDIAVFHVAQEVNKFVVLHENFRTERCFDQVIMLGMPAELPLMRHTYMYFYVSSCLLIRTWLIHIVARGLGIKAILLVFCDSMKSATAMTVPRPTC